MKKLTSPKKKFHIVFYVENCDSKVKKFFDKKAMKRFIEEFEAEYPKAKAIDTGSWVDYSITDIAGKATYLGG